LSGGEVLIKTTCLVAFVMTEEDYIKCVRSSLSGAKVFLQRKPYEVRVNPYMKVVLPAWKANHDLQFVLDPYACAMYIVGHL
jgi:hypothetical protein